MNRSSGLPPRRPSTSSSAGPLPGYLRTCPPPPVVVVIAEHDIVDDALVALVEKLGYVAVIHDVDRGHTGVGRPVVVIVRSRRRLDLVRAHREYRDASVFGIALDRDGRVPVTGIPADDGQTYLRALLERSARRNPALSTRPTPVMPLTDPVHVTAREVEVLSTYVLGATVRETARLHSIAESTVRAHYRRVTGRYAGAGRPVDNKAQLLRRLVADGHIAPETLPATDPVAARTGSDAAGPASGHRAHGPPATEPTVTMSRVADLRN